MVSKVFAKPTQRARKERGDLVLLSMSVIEYLSHRDSGGSFLFQAATDRLHSLCLRGWWMEGTRRQQSRITGGTSRKCPQMNRHGEKSATKFRSPLFRMKWNFLPHAARVRDLDPARRSVAPPIRLKLCAAITATR